MIEIFCEVPYFYLFSISGTNSSTSDQITPRERIPPSSPPPRDHCRDDKTQSVERVLSQERAYYEVMLHDKIFTHLRTFMGIVRAHTFYA